MTPKSPAKGEKAPRRRQSEGNGALSSQQLPKTGARGPASGDHACVKKPLAKIAGACKGDRAWNGFEFVDEMNQHFHAGGQIQEAANLAFGRERRADALVLPGALESPLVFEGEPRLIVPDPDVHDGVVILLKGRAGDGVERCDFDLRLPVRQQVLLGQRELNPVEFEGMKDLRKMRETRAIRVQHSGKLAVMFEQVHAFTGDPVHGRSGTKDALAERETARLNEPPDAPIEAVGRAFRAAVLHQLEQLPIDRKSTRLNSSHMSIS